MNDAVTQVESFYFGKSPTRGDFIRSTGHASMLHVLDQWVTQSFEAQAAHTDWQVHYDQMPQLDFVFCSTRTPLALVGTLTPSRDASHRRFPLIIGIRVQVTKPRMFVAQVPVIMQTLWQNVHILNQDIANTADPATVMQLLAQPLSIGVGGSLEYQAYLMCQTVKSFEQELNKAGHIGRVVQSFIALGLLLQPVISQGAANLSKTLILPLPQGVDSQKAATFWLNLVTGFIQPHAIEVSVLTYHRNAQPVLLIGFQGANSTTLAGLMRGDLSGEHWVHVWDAAWIDTYLENDAGLARLEQVLDDEQMLLLDVLRIFKDVFLTS